ncbi:MAG TPA: VOC family protein [Candidatus Binatia bacterium]|jgi:hypothetical protein|nr:VOC family protein [Candidatus Binatia bacterium]
MRLRQVVIAARDLESTVADLTAVFAIDVAYRDPGVGAFGLANAVLPIGDTFLEVVSPIDPTAPAERFLQRRGGDGGYMVMVQSPHLADDLARIRALGVRVVWQIDLDDISGAHLHPADVGAAILSIDEPRPAPSWRWAGPEWEQRIRRERVCEVTGVDLEAPDPAALAARWSVVLDAPEDDAHRIALDRGTIRVHQGATTAVRGYELAVTDAAAIVATARGRGLPAGDGVVTVAGTRFTLTSA